MKFFSRYKPVVQIPINSSGGGILADNIGDNISEKNYLYGELTATYSIWKNFLPLHPDIEYIGCCHYRRFFDFQKEAKKDKPFEIIDFKAFEKTFQAKNTKEEIEKIIYDYDIILPETQKFNVNVYSQFISRECNPKDDFEKCINIIKKYYPEYVPYLEKVLNENKLHTCLNFIMKKNLFNSWCKWIFDILFKLENHINIEDKNKIRILAFIAERLFDVWFLYQKDKNNLKVLQRHTYLLKDMKIYKFPFNIAKITKYDKRTIINILGIKLTIHQN